MDGITAQHLRHIPERAVLLILAIFNASLRFGFPVWKVLRSSIVASDRLREVEDGST